MEEYLKWIQLILNAIALGTAGWIYKAYIQNLKSATLAKEEQIKIVEKNLSLWKDKVQELEKKTPEFMEEALHKRIKIREEEIERLSSDNEIHEEELYRKNSELEILKKELDKTINIKRSMEFVGDDFDDYFFEREGELQIEQAGYVNVASGILLITDPIFINEDWQNEEYIDLRLYKDIETNKVYQYQKDFNNYEEKIGSIGQTVNELIKINRFVKIKIERDYNYSFAGSSYATLDNNGYGELQFSKGGEGAGIALDTAFGDGMFPVYIEKYNDRNIRAYINLI